MYNRDQKIVEVAILILHKVDFNLKAVTRNKEGSKETIMNNYMLKKLDNLEEVNKFLKNTTYQD